MNAYAEANRRAKVERIVEYVDTFLACGCDRSHPTTAAHLSHLSDEAWGVIAAATGGHPISTETRQAVVRRLEQRDADRQSAAHVNPFAQIGADA